jgi:CRISPR/Cas system CSM-associated protein Csm4 (group 5 of RAMP superfamily)
MQQPALLIRLRPQGPWRYGPDDGGHDRVDTLYRSDRLYSALTLAMERLGFLPEWLNENVHDPGITFSSLFPFLADALYAPPPSTLWPPPAALLTTPSPTFLTKIRWRAARFVPLSLIDSLLTGQPILADQWLPDPESGCLLRRDRPSTSPFRLSLRVGSPVDRISRRGQEAHSAACVEFEPSSGLWAVARFRDASVESTWSSRLEAAFRLLADSGFGGGRTKGWGKAHAPEFQRGSWPGLLLPKIGRLENARADAVNGGSPSLYWLLSLYSPAAGDTVDWSSGDYRLTVRSGRTESATQSGVLKKSVRMVEEGCVLAAATEPVGAAVDVAPDGFAHPVYRSGFALPVRLPVIEARVEQAAVEEGPAEEEARVEEAVPAQEPELYYEI